MTCSRPLARLLPGEFVQLRREAPRSQVVLHSRRDISQILVPTARVPDGRAQQHSCNTEDDELHVHLPGEIEAKLVQRQLCALPVKVGPPSPLCSVILTTLTCDPPMQSGRYHRTQWCWQVYAHQAPDCASSISSCCQSWSDVSCLLQGETEPQEGTVYKHPALRIGYVSQHATHHIGMNSHICQDHPLLIISRIAERHLEKTPIQYIQWRFQDGHDRMYLFQASLRCWIARTRHTLTVALSRRDLGEGHSRSHGRRQSTA